MNHGSNSDDIDTIVEDYFYLVKKVYRKNLHFKKPESVALTDDSMTVKIDNVEYDFDSEIHHNDGRGMDKIVILF